MEEFKCPVCGSYAVDETCEHTVFLAANEGGLIFLSEEYREHFLTVARQYLLEQGENEEAEGLSQDYFPTEIIPEVVERLAIDNLDYREWFDVPPSGLAMCAAFVFDEANIGA